MCADLVLDPRGSGRFQIPPGNAPRRSSAPPNALPRAPLAHPRNCIALRTTHCGARTVAVPSSARLEIDATVLLRNAALAVVWRPLHTAPSGTAAPMQLLVRPRSSSKQDTTASKCRRSPCCNCRGGEMRATLQCRPELPRTQLTEILRSRGSRTANKTLARGFHPRISPLRPSCRELCSSSWPDVLQPSGTYIV